MKLELINKLNELAAGGIKKSVLESEIGLPKNSISGVMAGKREMPDSWINKIETYFSALGIPGYGKSGPIDEDTDGVEELTFPIAEEPEKVEPRTQLVVENKTLKEKPSQEIKSKLSSLMDKINQDFGAGTIMTMKQKGQSKLESISTGSIGLDIALGVGGLPRGRIVEIYGPESSGKTTFCIHVMAEAQKKGLKCIIIDAEHAFDMEYATKLGVNVEELMISQPNNGEEALEVADRVISSGEVGVVVIDSVAALVPRAELDGEMGDSKMALQARLMSQAMRKISGAINRTNTICIFTNQLRDKIGIAYGNPEVTTGGNALKFYASIRLDIRRMAQIKDGEVSLGNKCKIKVVKNKVAPPFKIAELDILFGQGFNKMGEIVDIGVGLGIIQKSGSWYAYDTNKLGQGRESVQNLLHDNPELALEIENKIINKINK